YNAWQRGMAPRHWYNGLVPDWMEGGLAYGKVSFLSPDFFSKLPDLTNVGTVNISVRVPVSHPEIADFRCKVEDCSVGGNVVHSFAYGRFMHAGLRWHSDGQTRKFELLVVGRQGSQGNAGSLCFRTKGSSDVGIIHLGDGPAVYCATPMMMGVLCQQDKSVLEHSVPSDHGNAVMVSLMMEVKGHHTTPAALVTAMVSLSPPLPSDQLQSLVLPAGQPAWSGPLKCPGRGTVRNGNMGNKGNPGNTYAKANRGKSHSISHRNATPPSNAPCATCWIDREDDMLEAYIWGGDWLRHSYYHCPSRQATATKPFVKYTIAQLQRAGREIRRLRTPACIVGAHCGCAPHVPHSGKFPFFFAANYKHGLPRVPRGGLPLLHCNCDVVKELDGVLTKVFKHEDEESSETADEKDDREMLEAYVIETVKEALLLDLCLLQHQCLPPLQGQRNKQPDCNLSQASPSEEVFVYMHLIVSLYAVMGCGCSDDSGGWDLPPFREGRVVPYPRSAPSPPSVPDNTDVLFGYGCEERRGRPADRVCLMSARYVQPTVPHTPHVPHSGKFPLSFAASYKNRLPHVPRGGLPFECCNCDIVAELDVVLTEAFKREDEEEWETEDENDDREMPDGIPSTPPHRSPPSLSSRPSSAAAELPIAIKDPRFKRTVSFCDMQEEEECLIDDEERVWESGDEDDDGTMPDAEEPPSLSLHRSAYVIEMVKAALLLDLCLLQHQCLPPLQGQRNKQPDCNLSQASPSEEVFVYMHLIGGCYMRMWSCDAQVITKVPAPSNAPERRSAVPAAAQEVMGMPAESPGAQLKEDRYSKTRGPELVSPMHFGDRSYARPDSTLHTVCAVLCMQDEERETADEDDDREVLGAEWTNDRPSSTPSIPPHRLSPSSHPSLHALSSLSSFSSGPSFSSRPLLSSRPASAAAELPNAFMDHRFKSTVSLCDEQHCCLTFAFCSVQVFYRFYGNASSNLMAPCHRLHHLMRYVVHAPYWRLLCEQRRIEVPLALMQVGQLMKAAGSSSPNNKEASEPMLAERVAGGRLPGTEPLSPLGKAALEEVRLLDAWFACCYISLHDTPRAYVIETVKEALLLDLCLLQHQSLPPLQGQRNKQPDCNLSQASPSEEVFVYMHLIGGCYMRMWSCDAQVMTKVPAPSNAPERSAVPAAAQEVMGMPAESPGAQLKEDRYSKTRGPELVSPMHFGDRSYARPEDEERETADEDDDREVLGAEWTNDRPSSTPSIPPHRLSPSSPPSLHSLSSLSSFSSRPSFSSGPLLSSRPVSAAAELRNAFMYQRFKSTVSICDEQHGCLTFAFCSVQVFYRFKVNASSTLMATCHRLHHLMRYVVHAPYWRLLCEQRRIEVPLALMQVGQLMKAAGSSSPNNKEASEPMLAERVAGGRLPGTEPLSPLGKAALEEEDRYSKTRGPELVSPMHFGDRSYARPESTLHTVCAVLCMQDEERETADEDDDREVLGAEWTNDRPSSTPSIPPHRLSPSSPPSLHSLSSLSSFSSRPSFSSGPLLSSRPVSAAAELRNAFMYQRFKSTVSICDEQHGCLTFAFCSVQVFYRFKVNASSTLMATCHRLHHLMRYVVHAPYWRLLCEQRRIEVPLALMQVGQLMKAAGSSSPNNKEASEPMLAERVAGGRLPGTEPLSPLGKAALEEEDRYSKTRGPELVSPMHFGDRSYARPESTLHTVCAVLCMQDEERETADEDDDREVLGAEWTNDRPSSTPSIPPHRLSPSSPPSLHSLSSLSSFSSRPSFSSGPLLSSRPVSAAAELRNAFMYQRFKSTVSICDEQHGCLTFAFCSVQVFYRFKVNASSNLMATCHRLHHLMRYVVHAPYWRLLCEQRRIEVPLALMQVGQLMKAAGSSSPNNKEASEPMLAERVAGGRLPGTEPLSPLGKAALEEEDRYSKTRGPELVSPMHFGDRSYARPESTLHTVCAVLCMQDEERETADEDDDREVLGAEWTNDRPSSTPSIPPHRLSPSSPPSLHSLSSLSSFSSRPSFSSGPLLSSRPVSAAAELRNAFMDQRFKSTVSICDEQHCCLTFAFCSVQVFYRFKVNASSNLMATCHRLHHLMRYVVHAPYWRLLCEQRRIEVPLALMQVGQLMKAAGSSSPNNKEASEPMLAERVAGGRLPGTEPLSPLGKAALEEEDRYNEAGGPQPGEPALDPREAGTAALTRACPAAPQPAAPLLAKPAVKAKPAMEVKVEVAKTSGGGEKAVQGKDGPPLFLAAALVAEPAIKQAKPAVEVKVQNSAASSSAEKAGKAKDSPDPAPAQLMLSYKLVLHVRDGVKETGSKVQGGDGTVLRLQAALEAQGFSVFVGESGASHAAAFCLKCSALPKLWALSTPLSAADIEGGDSWTQAIQAAIDGEVLYALSEHKAIIPVWHRQEASSGWLGVKPAGKQPIALAAGHSAAAAWDLSIAEAGLLQARGAGQARCRQGSISSTRQGQL
ncbi:hypothetical protein QJQ45_027377, partial [Haematococcus lacustris]